MSMTRMSVNEIKAKGLMLSTSIENLCDSVDSTYQGRKLMWATCLQFVQSAEIKRAALEVYLRTNIINSGAIELVICDYGEAALDHADITELLRQYKYDLANFNSGLLLTNVNDLAWAWAAEKKINHKLGAALVMATYDLAYMSHAGVIDMDDVDILYGAVIARWSI
jgi:hypothetical protein